MKKIILILAFIGLLIILAIGSLSQKDFEPTTLMKLKDEYSKKYPPSVDHSKICCC